MTLSDQRITQISNPESIVLPYQMDVRFLDTGSGNNLVGVRSRIGRTERDVYVSNMQTTGTAIVKWLNLSEQRTTDILGEFLPAGSIQVTPSGEGVKKTLDTLISGATRGEYSPNMVRAVDELIASLRAAGVVESITNGQVTLAADIATAAANSPVMAARLRRWSDLPGAANIVRRAIQVGVDARVINEGRDPTTIRKVTLQHLIRFEYIQQGNELQFEQMAQMRQFLTATDSTIAVLNRLQDVIMGKEAESAKLDLAALQRISDAKNAGLRDHTEASESFWIDFDNYKLSRETTLNDPNPGGRGQRFVTVYNQYGYFKGRFPVVLDEDDLANIDRRTVPGIAGSFKELGANGNYFVSVGFGYGWRYTASVTGALRFDQTAKFGGPWANTNQPEYRDLEGAGFGTDRRQHLDGGSRNTDVARTGGDRLIRTQVPGFNFDGTLGTRIKDQRGVVDVNWQPNNFNVNPGVESDRGGFVSEQRLFNRLNNDNARNPEEWSRLVEDWEASQFENRKLNPESSAAILGYQELSIGGTEIAPGSVLDNWINAFKQDEDGVTLRVIGNPADPNFGRIINPPYGDPEPGITLESLIRTPPGGTEQARTENLLRGLLNNLTTVLIRQKDKVDSLVSSLPQSTPEELVRNLNNMSNKLGQLLISIEGLDRGQNPNILAVILDLGTGGVEEGQFQQDVDAAFVAAQASNDSFKEELRRRMFEFEEFYKSASAVMSKITQIIEKIAQNISR